VRVRGISELTAVARDRTRVPPFSRTATTKLLKAKGVGVAQFDRKKSKKGDIRYHLHTHSS
jgi:hypothetical protein